MTYCLGYGSFEFGVDESHELTLLKQIILKDISTSTNKIINYSFQYMYLAVHNL